MGACLKQSRLPFESAARYNPSAGRLSSRRSPSHPCLGPLQFKETLNPAEKKACVHKVETEARVEAITMRKPPNGRCLTRTSGVNRDVGTVQKNPGA